MSKSPSSPSEAAKNSLKTRLNFYSQSFQMRYGIWLATIGVFCFLVMGFLIYMTILRTIQASAQPEVVRDLAQRLLKPSTIFLSYEVVIPAFILMTFLFAIGIVGTHRIAGPIFAINRHMNRVRTGQSRGLLTLRQGDELWDVVSTLNSMLAMFWQRDKSLADDLQEVAKLLERSDAPGAREKLNELIARLEAGNRRA